MQYFNKMIPCEFCHVRLPNRFCNETNEIWEPDLDVLHLHLNENLFAVDIELYHAIDRDLGVFFNREKHRLRKIHCIHAHGNMFDVRQIAPCMARLQSLNLNGIEIGRANLRILCERTFILEELVLRVSTEVICDDLISLFSQNLLLRHIHIINHRRLGCNCLSQIAVHPLQYLSLTSCNFPSNFIDCAKKWINLKRILVEFCINVPDNFMQFMLLSMPKLEALRCHFMYDERTLPKRFPADYSNNITVIAIFNNSLINDILLLEICCVCKKLEHLYLGTLYFNTADAPEVHSRDKPILKLTDLSISELHTLTQLTCLGLFGLYIDDDEPEEFNELSRITSLEVLYLVTANSKNATDIGCHVFRHCYKLHTLLLLGYVFRRGDLLRVIEPLEEYSQQYPNFMLRLLVNSSFAEMDYIPHPNLTVYPTMMAEFVTVIERICA